MSSPLRKRLTYRDQVGRSLLDHTEHWIGFQWTSGPVIVKSIGPWGQVQVWAESEEEGKRVIRHAGYIAGFDPDEDPEAEWIVETVANPSYGKQATMEVRRLRHGVAVTKRDGAFGQPEVVDGSWG